MTFNRRAFAQDKKDLVIGATAGPYADQVKQGIRLLLEKKGYRVTVVEFNDYVQPNFALAQGSLDASVFRHIVYLTRFATPPTRTRPGSGTSPRPAARASSWRAPRRSSRAS